MFQADIFLADGTTLLGAMVATYCDTLKKLENDFLNETAFVTEIAAFPLFSNSEEHLFELDDRRKKFFIFVGVVYDSD
jgi:hypothetical protein